MTIIQDRAELPNRREFYLQRYICLSNWLSKNH